MGEQKKIQTRTSEELGSLERFFFGAGGVIGVIVGGILGDNSASSAAYFGNALPLFVLAFPFAYQVTLKDAKSSVAIAALASGGCLVGEAVQMIARNYF